MGKWSDIYREIRSIPEDEKQQIDDVAKIASIIIDRRKYLGLTQADVAERSGLKQSAIARFENTGAIPRLDTLLKIVKVLGMEININSLESSHRPKEEAAAIIY